MRPYLRVANVFEDRIDTTSVLEMNFTPEEFETYRLECGDVLLNEGQSLHLVGRPAIYRGEVPGACFQNTLVRFRPYPGLRSEFALMVFRGYLHTQRFMRIARWTTNIAHLGAGRFAEIEFPLAPFPEQERIVEAVESYLTRLDAAVKTLERVQANLGRYRASVLKAALEGRLVPTEAELAHAEGRDYEPASVLLERVIKERRRWRKESGGRGRYKEPVEPDAEGLPELPDGWCWATVDQLAGDGGQGLCDGPFGSNLKTAHYTQSGPRVVRLQNIGDGTFLDGRAHIATDHFERLRKHSVVAGDVVVASLGETLPRACIIPGWLGSAIVKADCIRFRTSPLTNHRFLCHALNSPLVRNRTKDKIHGVGRPRLGLKGIREIVLPLSPVLEQERIAAEVDHQMSVIDASERTIELQLGRCDRLRQSILKWAFEGKLADQDPADEPAAVLLERISAEREATKPKKGTRRGRPRSRA